MLLGVRGTDFFNLGTENLPKSAFGDLPGLGEKI